MSIKVVIECPESVGNQKEVVNGSLHDTMTGLMDRMGGNEVTVSPRNKSTTAKALQREISGEMRDLPVEALLALREFAAFLRYRRGTQQPVALDETESHPTVEMPVDTLLQLADILPRIGGNALADTEALYDQD